MIRSAKILLPLLLLWAVAGLALVASAQDPGPQDLAATAQRLLDEIQANRAEMAKLREEREAADGEERVLIRRRIIRLGLEAVDKVGLLVDNLAEQQAQGVDARELRDATAGLLAQLATAARERIDALQSELSDLRGQRQSTTGEELVKLEAQIGESDELLNLLLAAALDNADRMERLGLPGGREKAALAEILRDRAATSGERIALALDQISALNERLDEKPDDSNLRVELSAIEAKRDRSEANLKATIAMMERLELDTADYRELLIRATGEITSDILDTQVAVGLFSEWLADIGDWARENGPHLIFKAFVFLLILLAFRVLSRMTRRIVGRAVSTSKLQLSQLLQKTFVSVSGNVVMAIGILVGLSQLGFSLGPILAGLGIAGFIVGFALQETLGNFAAGLMILVYRPFDVGDLIEAAGVFGKVSAMSMVSTTILTIDNQTLIVPNGKIWGDVIKNVTGQKIRRVDMVFGASYADDVAQTERVLASILAEHPKVLPDPPPMIKLHKLGESSVDFIVRPWVNTEDYWEVYWDVTREVKMRFDREGISIPFPQRDVHFYEERRFPSGPTPPREGAVSGR